jgi:hypothetical protein
MNEGLIPHSSSYRLTATHSVSYPLTATHSVSYPLTATHSVSYPLTATHFVSYPLTAIHSMSHDCKHLNHVFNSELRLSQSIMHSILSSLWPFCFTPKLFNTNALSLIRPVQNHVNILHSAASESYLPLLFAMMYLMLWDIAHGVAQAVPVPCHVWR